MGPSPRAVAALHACYLVGTGVWPLLHRSSFERVTGKKQDFWLVRTVGGLAAATGLSLGVAAVRGSKAPESSVLALTTGVVFGIADVHAARLQSRVYLADVALQMAFATAWTRRWKPS